MQLSPLMLIICLLMLYLTRKVEPIHNTNTQRDAFIKFYNCAKYVCLRFEILYSPWQVVQRMVTEILTVPGVSRVLYDLTAKPPGTTEWEWCFALNLIAFYTKLCVMLSWDVSVVHLLWYIHVRLRCWYYARQVRPVFLYCAWGLAVWIICDKLHFFQREIAIGRIILHFLNQNYWGGRGKGTGGIF